MRTMSVAVLGTRLMDNVKQGSCVLWTDSKTVLHWISSTHRRYKQFVGNDGGGLKIYEGVTMQMNSIERVRQGRAHTDKCHSNSSNKSQVDDNNFDVSFFFYFSLTCYVWV